MSGEQILVWIVIGGIAGIIAEALVGGLRSGLIGAIVVAQTNTELFRRRLYVR